MKRLMLLSLLALSLGVNAAFAGLALWNRRPAATMPLLGCVTLDSAQKARVKALRERFLAQRERNQARTAELRGRLAEVLSSDAPERADTERVIAEIAEAQIALQHQVVEHLTAVRAVLRPEQRPDFEKCMVQQLRAGAPMGAQR